jgi:hypothetical protein
LSGTRSGLLGDRALSGLDFDHTEEVAFRVGEHRQAHAGVFVEHLPAEGGSEPDETVDLGPPLPPRDAEVEVHLLIVAGCCGAAVEVEPETVRGVGLKEGVGVATAGLTSVASVRL